MDGKPLNRRVPTSGEIEQARLNPNGWVYRIEGEYTDSETIPPEAIIGAWKVDVSGCIEGDFTANPNYKGAS